ncbi:spore germination protein GerW family protein [Georgenia daeguensis]|uniref:Sporulation protein n=1 Tax=Georgenia daeguensis TaxID=908355 RepID=A0ABP8EXT4_9MICO
MDRGSTSVDLITESARDSLTVRRVFGEAYVVGETTVIPVAKVMGGSGMGYGGAARPDARGAPGAQDGAAGGAEGEGGGGGFGMLAKPAGVFVVHDGSVQWQPALDVNRLAVGGQILVAVAALAWAFRRRR